MKERTKILSAIAVVVVLISSTVAFSMYEKLPEGPKGPPEGYDATRVWHVQNNLEPRDISLEMPERFKGVEMTTYESTNGYEITYPASWTGSVSLAEDQLTGVELEQAVTLESNFLFPHELLPTTPAPIHIEVLSSKVNDFGKDLINNSGLLPVKLNELKGFYFNSHHLVFLAEDFIYNIYLTVPVQELVISEEDLLWVVSTLKIDNQLLFEKQQTEIIAVDKPARFDSMEMEIFKGRYGFEITHPKGWETTIPESPEALYLNWPNKRGEESTVTMYVFEENLDEFLSRDISYLIPVQLNNLSGYYYTVGPRTVFVFSNDNYTAQIFVSPSPKMTKEEGFWIASTLKIPTK